ncbi:hypothetical protein [Alicycliphilus denitrificans]|uniref:hypothetical protein n=1 Tax=Alicycliphilus denitrificans TaxID=179636 RepID=UPI00384E4434
MDQTAVVIFGESWHPLTTLILLPAGYPVAELRQVNAPLGQSLTRAETLNRLSEKSPQDDRPAGIFLDS